MSEINRVIISLGSNQDSEMNIECAIMELQAHFASIYFSEPVYTKPVGDLPNKTPFLNQIAVGYTPDEPDELKSLFKEIEQLLGRNPQDDKEGIIPVDIDLLLWNSQSLKPEDMQRDYVVKAIRELMDKGV